MIKLNKVDHGNRYYLCGIVVCEARLLYKNLMNNWIKSSETIKGNQINIPFDT